jgi:hypothetical protein
MKLFGWKLSKDKGPEKHSGLRTFGYEPARIELPEIIEERSLDWVKYGKNNCYPRELIKLTETCSLHNAIVDSKAIMMAGKSIKINGMTIDEYIATVDLNEGAKQRFQLAQFEAIRHKLSLDYQHFGAYAYELVFSMDFSRIVEVNHVNVADIRSGKYVNGRVRNYWYSRNWKDTKKYPPESIVAYDPKDQMNYRQLVYRYKYTPNNEYYGKPTYQSGLCWIKLDSETGLFHLSNMENGFYPGMHISFFKTFENQEEEQQLIRQLNQQFKGASKAGNKIVTFSDGKENAVEMKPIQNTDLDKQFILIGETAIQQILSAHKVTSPMLMGIATPGKLGYANELENSQKIFEAQVIAPERNMLQADLAFIYRYNGFSQKLELEQFNPLA